jgi:hypothetical protein
MSAVSPMSALAATTPPTMRRSTLRRSWVSSGGGVVEPGVETEIEDICDTPPASLVTSTIGACSATRV